MHYDSPTIVYGLAAGVTLCFSNIALLESLRRLDISVGSTVYRLNTVGVVILSVLFLNESIGWLKGVGIIMGIFSVLFLYAPSGRSQGGCGTLFFLAVAVSASLMRAVYGVITKAGMLHLVDPQLMLTVVAPCWIIGGLLYAGAMEKRPVFGVRPLVFSGASGMLVFLIVFFLTKALQYGETTVVIPIANMSFLVAISLAAMLRIEHITLKKGAALGIAAAAILCLSLS